MRWLALVGSLRVQSHNRALLQAAAVLAAPTVRVERFDLGTLPLFNPDVEAAGLPPSVAALRAALNASAGVLIASPEYAHGVSGVIKNALDWMVGNESFVGKPVAIFNASARATLADAALREVLVTMSARIIDAASVTLALAGTSWTAQRILTDPALRTRLQAALRDFAAGCATAP